MDLRRHTLALCLGFTLALLASSGLDAGEPRRGGTLRIGYVQDITGLDPHTSGGFPAAYIQQNLFQSLVTLNEALEIVPELADSWEVHDGGKTYVFHLRHGVQFHDATPFDAQAVKWNFERLLNPEEAVLFRGFFASVDTVEVVDAQTVHQALGEPAADLSVRQLEDRGILDPHGGEARDAEEAAVVQIGRLAPPAHELVVLTRVHVQHVVPLRPRSRRERKAVVVVPQLTPVDPQRA